jgi:hypothetical protein
MIEPQSILEISRRFYRQHNLVDWADALPSVVGSDAADATELARAEKHGFTLAFAFPAFDLQMQTLERLIDETIRKPAPVADNQQYAEPFLADTWSKVPNGKVLQQTDDVGARAWSPYLLFLSPKPIQQGWGRTGKQIREFLDGKGWRGLTVPEYLVLQRYLCEKHQDHRFFEEPEDDSGSHSLWLIDSMTDKDCAVVHGHRHGVSLQATSIANRDSRRAAVAGLVCVLGA